MVGSLKIRCINSKWMIQKSSGKVEYPYEWSKTSLETLDTLMDNQNIHMNGWILQWMIQNLIENDGYINGKSIHSYEWLNTPMNDPRFCWKKLDTPIILKFTESVYKSKISLEKLNIPIDYPSMHRTSKIYKWIINNPQESVKTPMNNQWFQRGDVGYSNNLPVPLNRKEIFKLCNLFHLIVDMYFVIYYNTFGS